MNMQRYLCGPFWIAATLALVAYSSIIILQAFNADDIIQSQPIAADYNTFLSAGRWGYYLLYKTLSGANPLGPFGLIVGVFILSLSSAIAAEVVGLQANISRSVFVVVGTVSLYYSSVFSFDSTRIAYPTASLLAVLAVYLAQKHWNPLLSIAAICVATAIFQSSVQIALTAIIASSILPLLYGNIHQAVLKCIKPIICLVIGVIVYLFSIRFSVFLTGIPLSGRSAINVLDALSHYDRLLRLFWGHSLPNGYQLPNFSFAMKLLLWAIFILFLYNILRILKFRLKLCVLSLLVIFCLLVSPFALAFVSPLDEFTPRALIAFSLVHASFAAISIEITDLRNYFRQHISTLLAGIYVFLCAVQINGTAFDEYLTSRNDILATNRIINRIDEVIAGSAIPMNGPIPLAVRYQNPYSTSPRGEPATARASPWAKEWIFRHIDPRFVPVSKEFGDQLFKKSPSVKWPDPLSIYIDGSTVVVIIN